MFKEKSLSEMQALTEAKLVKEIILPLLESIGFDTIEHRHGILEKGVDILCIKRNELLNQDVIAIQVKKSKFSGNVTKSDHLYRILTQLNQCWTEPIKLKDGTIKKANRIWFISPFIIDGVALEVAFEKYAEDFRKNVVIIDGDKLYQLICSYSPELLSKLGDKQVAYVENFRNETPILKEAATFGLKDKKYLTHQYVQMHLSPLPEKLINLCVDKFEIILGKAPIKNQFQIFMMQEFNLLCKSVLKYEPLEIQRNSNLIFAKDFNALTFLNLLKNCANAEIADFISCFKGSTEDNIASLKKLVLFISNISKIILNDIFREIALVPNKSNNVYYFDISIEQILKSRINFQIVADAGAGKTTLLRMIGLEEVNHFSGRLPVFVALANFKNKTGLLQLIKDSCISLGLSLTETQINEYLDDGKMILLLDGLDEAGSTTSEIQKEIINLLETHDKVQFIFTTRPWSAIQNHDLFTTINILPFTKKQVKQFFSKWFYEDSTASKEIIEHLEKNPHLYNIVSTPLVATIIAAIKTHGGKLPKDLIDVYSERLRLLLNDWDNIKGVKRDKFELEDKKFFMRKLAFLLHSRHLRTISFDTIVNLVIEVIGNIHKKDEAQLFVNELINNNNMLFKNDLDEWGFGHLQYQEYLAALELKENPNINKVPLLNNGWWYKVLENYAFMTRDISALIEDTRNSNYEIDKYVFNIFRLLTKAPNTDKALKNYIVTLKEHNLYDYGSELEDELEYIIEFNVDLLKLLWETHDKKRY